MPDAPSLRDTLSEAFDNAEAPAVESAPVEASPVEVPEAPEAAPAEAPPVSAKSRDGKGRFAKGTGKPPTPAPTAASETVEAGGQVSPPSSADAPASTELSPKPEAPAAEALKPPASFKPLAREEWAKVPPTVQAEVVRRERETAIALQEASEARKGWGAFREAVAPFEHLARAEGADVLQATANLWQSAALLRTGAPAQKAKLLANLVRAYDVPIPALDAELSGQPAPQQGAADYRDPRVDQLLGQLQRQQEAARQAAMAESQRQVEEFGAKHEFFDDVRDTMADFVELAARRGEKLSVEDAYAAALAHPRHKDIADVLRQREAAKQAQASSAQAQRARLASSSVRSQPAAPTSGAQPQSLRDFLEAAVAQHS